MSNALPIHLQKFQKQIFSLVPYSTNAKLGYLIEKLLPEASSGEHLAVQNEIKNLALQCNKPIDLRSLFDNCNEITHNKVTHYLDPGAKELFNHKLLEFYNLYTIAIYHEVFEDAKDRAAQHNSSAEDNSKASQQVLTTNKVTAKQSGLIIDKTEPKPLVNKNIIECELKKLNSSCKVFVNPIMGMTSEGKKEVGITASIEKMNNRKVVIQTTSEITGVKSKKVYLWLYDHHKEVDFSEELELGFEVIDSQELSPGGSVEYLLKYSSPITEKQMRSLFSYFLKKKNLATIGPTEHFITPLFDSITSKGYEQLYLNKAHDIPLLCYKNNGAWRAKVAMKTSGNGELWSFFSDLNDSSHKAFYLPVLLGNQDIQRALDECDTVDKYAILLKSTFNETTTYSLIWYDDFIHEGRVKTLFNKYVKDGYFKVVKISSVLINSVEDAYVPSALPSHVHPKMAVLNRAPPKRAIEMINDCDRMLTVSDITSLYETINRPIKKPIVELEELLPKKHQLTPVGELVETEIVTAEDDDSRSEERFALSFDITISRSNNRVVNIPGMTKNISTQGLLIALEKATKFKAGEEIEIEITVPFKEEARTFKKQKYVVLGYDTHGNVRILMNAIESKHLAYKAIRKYLYQHTDTLETSGKKGSRVYGLQKAMRNIYAHNHFSIPFYLKSTKHQQYINAASFSGNSALKNLVYKNDTSEKIILNLLSNKKFRESCLSIIAVISFQEVKARSFYILVLPKDKNEENDYSFWYRDLSVLKKSSQLQAYMKKVSSIGKPAILKVELKKSSKTCNMYYRDEIAYLKSLDKDLANDIEIQLESTIGIGEVTDLTDIAIDMINDAS